MSTAGLRTPDALWERTNVTVTWLTQTQPTLYTMRQLLPATGERISLLCHSGVHSLS